MIEILIYLGVVSACVYFVPINKSENYQSEDKRLDYFREKLLY